MSGTDIKNKTEQESQIITYLENLHEDPTAVNKFGKLIKLANSYVQVDTDIAEAKDARFKTHQLCSRCQIDRESNDSDAQRERRLRFRLQVCMLRALSFKVNRSIDMWLQGLYSTIKACTECYKGFLRAKSEIGPQYLHTFEKDQVEQFLVFSEEWEEKKALETLAQHGSSSSGVGKALSPSPLYAVMALAGCLASRQKRDGLYDKLKSARDTLPLSLLPEVPSGLLAMAIDDDADTRSRIAGFVGLPHMSDEVASGHVVKTLLRQGIQKECFDGVAVFLSMAPTSLNCATLSNILERHFSGETSEALPSFNFFQTILETRGRTLWDGEDVEYSLVVLTTILDNARYRSLVLQPASDGGFLSWMRPFLASLISLDSKRLQERNSSEDITGKGRIFEDAFKRIIYFLIDTMQQSAIAVDVRDTMLKQAVGLLLHFLTLDESLEPDDIALAAQTAARVITLHASIFVGIALRGRLPNSKDTLASDSKTRKAALALIQENFAMDCNTLSDNFLLLSSATTQHHASYKRLQKLYGKRSEQKEESVKAFEKLFSDAAKELEVGSMISSELWKEAYNAFDTKTDDVGVFLQPLAGLSTFTIPQISSHVIPVKSEHEQSPGYLTYVERLKSCIVSYKGRLRSVRYSLPRVLLDACDELSTGSRGTQRLTAVCYKLADTVVQANLCPEQEVHKSAQNLVRTTFEDAETREDCFRALIQCNPVLALSGIREYLESFLVAATNLVEANEAAKWMVRSFSDILNVLCSETEGLLRQGIPFSLVDNSNVKSQVQVVLPTIWHLMCRSIAIIFKRTPSWSHVLPHRELTAWFRDVLLFASELAEQVEVMQAAVEADDEETESQAIIQGLLTDLALPLEEAVSWFRMNDVGIVQETRDYFIKGLRCFNSEVKLPAQVKTRVLAFIDAQSRIEDSKSRMTLLTLKELNELRLLLDPRDVIEIEDSSAEEEEEAALLGLHTPPPPERKDDSLPAKTRQETVPVSRPRTQQTERNLARIEETQRILKQQKLSFQKIDASSSRPFVSKAAPPKPQFASTAIPANRYQSAATKTYKPSSSAFAEARRTFNATSWKRAPRLGHFDYGREMPEPQAPAAKRTFAAAPMESKAADVVRSGAVEGTASESSASDSDDEGGKTSLGLADLVAESKSPVKMRPKPKAPTKPPIRRTVMMEDLEARRRQREQEEAERKRKLREGANLNPLHRTILSWDFYTESSRPPRLNSQEEEKYETIKNVYGSPQAYTDTFSPMLNLEAWANFTSARQLLDSGALGSAPYTVTIAGRSVLDSFVIVTASLQVNSGMPSAQLNDADMVYIREIGSSGQRARTVLAKVDAFRNDSARKTDRLTLRCCLQGDTQGMSSLLVTGTSFEMGKLFTLTTLHREYQALQVMPYYNMLPNILQAKCSVREEVSEHDIAQAQLDYSINRPQAEAILGSLKAQQGFNLIQGPPGTGKTKTICSLVAHFIQTRQSAAVPVRAGQSSSAAATLANAVKKKILLCAPSNAAVDEVARRVHEGVTLKNGKAIKPIVVRLGREDAMNISVKSFSLDALVERKLSSSSRNANLPDDSIEDPSQMRIEIRRLKDEREAKRAELEDARLTGKNEKVIAQLDVEVRTLGMRRMDLMSKLDEAKDKSQTVHRQKNADRKRAEQDVLAGADVVCTTLGGAGHNMLFDLPFDFETVVIDEASQAVELDTLIPLRHGCERCILVGDPNQLPPTVISQLADKLNYSRSLFVRLFNNPKNYTNLLSIQYRMNPSISKFPSVEFYEGRLTDGEGMATLTAKVWHKDPLLAPFRFFDCKESKERTGKGKSLVNRGEALMAAAIYERLRKEALRLGSTSVEGKVGVITMYKDQVAELKRAFEALYGRGIENAVDFGTVDGFQGQEKDTIILSCVRSEAIGFLSDFRRVNVAITRAKSNLFIVGNATNLERSGKGTIWPRLIEMARREGSYMSLSSDAFRRPAFPSTAPLPPVSIGRTPSVSNGAATHARDRNATEEAPPSLHKMASSSTVSAQPSPVKRKIALTPESGEAARKRRRSGDGVAISPPTSSSVRTPTSGTTPTGQGPSRPMQPPVRPAQPRPTGTRPPIVARHQQQQQQRPSSSQHQHHPRPPPASRTASNVRPGGSTGNGVLIHPPAPVANLPRPPPRPAQIPRTAVFSSQEGPSDKAKSSLFMTKSKRATKPKLKK